MNIELVRSLVPVLVETIKLLGTLDIGKEGGDLTLDEIRVILEDVEWPELAFGLDN